MGKKICSDRQRKEFVENMNRMREAALRTESKKLRRDYMKAVSRMHEELERYDAYKRGNQYV